MSPQGVTISGTYNETTSMDIKMNDFKFIKENFYFNVEEIGKGISSTQMADRAQELLDAYLNTLPTIFGHENGEFYWNSVEDDEGRDTHIAKVICKKEIDKVSQDLTKTEAISILKQALYEIKDAPLSREEMIEKAQITLAKTDWIEK